MFASNIVLRGKHYDVKWLIEEYEKGIALKFLFFWGHTAPSNAQVGKECLSQWFYSPFAVNNISYKTAEHWMMAQKALLFEDNKTFEKIIHCEKPGEAKELGRQVLGFDEQIWNENRFDIVKLGNIHKFNQHIPLGEFLLNTNERILVEASPVDTIWGIGLSRDDADSENIYAWRGLNLLGFVLMEVRDFLKDFGFFETNPGLLQPPWLHFPDIDPTDMFWQMGKGEEYLAAFFQQYKNADQKTQITYQLNNPPPYQWRTFFND